MYKIRVILDTKEDVLRTLSIDETCNLEQLHYAIIDAFGFEGQEMASFFRTDEDWNQGEEIPLFNMEDDGVSMATSILKKTLKKVNDKLIYIYDFLNMWTFYVELIEVSKEKVKGAKIILSVGELPKTAPEPKFKVDNDIFEDDFDEFEDDYDQEDYGYDDFY